MLQCKPAKKPASIKTKRNETSEIQHFSWICEKAPLAVLVVLAHTQLTLLALINGILIMKNAIMI